MARRGPTQCIQHNPSKKNKTITFGGCFINIHEIERDHGLNPGYVSRILSGKANPTAAYLKKLSAALGMSITNLLTAIDERSQEMLENS